MSALLITNTLTCQALRLYVRQSCWRFTNIQLLYVLILFNDTNVCLLKFLLYTMYMYFCRFMSLTYNFCSHLTWECRFTYGLVVRQIVQLKHIMRGFMRWKKLLQMVLTCWIYSQEIRFMLHLFIFLNTNKSYRQSRYYSLHWAHTVIGKNISD